MPKFVGSYRDQLYARWRKAQLRAEWGERMDWAAEKLTEAIEEAQQAKADLEAYERHLLAGGKLHR